MMRGMSAFTRIELVVVIIAVFAVLFALFWPFLRSFKKPSDHDQHISCANNLKEIGTAYRLWAGDNGDLVPSQQSVTKGGWKEFLTNANQGAICWTNYTIMQDDMGQVAKSVICPQDKRVAAESFASNFDNTHVSYFVGVSANNTYPQSIAGGDRNLGPGTKPSLDFHGQEFA